MKSMGRPVRQDDSVDTATVGPHEASWAGAVRQQQRPSLGALLVLYGIATDEQVKDALAEGMTTGERFGEVVVRKGWTSEQRLAKLLAEQWELRYLEADQVSIDPDALQRATLSAALELGVLPIGIGARGVLLAIAEPNQQLFEAVEGRIGEASYVVVAHSVVDRLLAAALPAGAEPPRAPLVPGVAASEAAVEAANGAHDETRPLTRADREQAAEESQHDRSPPPAPAFAVAAWTGGGGVEETSDADFADVELSPSAHDLDATLGSIDAATDALRDARRETIALGEELAAVREQLVARESELAVAEQEARRQQEAVRALERQLAERGEVFASLREQVAALTRTVELGHPS